MEHTVYQTSRLPLNEGFVVTMRSFLGLLRLVHEDHGFVVHVHAAVASLVEDDGSAPPSKRFLCLRPWLRHRPSRTPYR
jgi:hypothetical protein